MRKFMFTSAALILCVACDPRRPHIQVVPQSVCAGETVTVSWRADDHRPPAHPSTTPIRIIADHPTTPSIETGEVDGWRGPAGAVNVDVTTTTTFTAVVPGGARSNPPAVVTVRTGGTASFSAFFTGECRDGLPPLYAARTIAGHGLI